MTLYGGPAGREIDSEEKLRPLIYKWEAEI